MTEEIMLKDLDVIQIEEIGRSIAHHGSDRGAGGSKAKSEDKHWIKDNVDNGTNDCSKQRGSRKPFRAQRIVRNQRKNHERRPERNIKIVTLRIGKCIC